MKSNSHLKSFLKFVLLVFSAVIVSTTSLAADIGSSNTLISSPGYYELKEDITGQTLDIRSEDVILEGNGNSIQSKKAISINPSEIDNSNITVQNIDLVSSEESEGTGINTAASISDVEIRDTLVNGFNTGLEFKGSGIITQSNFQETEINLNAIPQGRFEEAGSKPKIELSNNQIIDTTINSKYLTRISQNKIEGSETLVKIKSYNDVSGNDLSGSGSNSGILVNGHGNLVQNNKLDNLDTGIRIEGSQDNLIGNNQIVNNSVSNSEVIFSSYLSYADEIDKLQIGRFSVSGEMINTEISLNEGPSSRYYDPRSDAVEFEALDTDESSTRSAVLGNIESEKDGGFEMIKKRDGSRFLGVKKFHTVEIPDLGDTSKENHVEYFYGTRKDGKTPQLPSVNKKCVDLVSNGESEKKVDVVFVGDGYQSNEALRSHANQIIDISGENNGLMAHEPLSTNREKFNFYIVNGGDEISNDESGDPDRTDSLNIAAECTSAEYQIILSRQNFRSYAFRSSDAYISVGDELESKDISVVTHEFGHSFGNLRDEYIEPSQGDRPGAPNCAGSREEAEQLWGGIAEKNNNVGYFNGCSYVSDNIRPTENSLMRNPYVNLNPYIQSVEFGPVNERKLRQVLENYE